MPGPIPHLTSAAVASIVTYKWLNPATIICGVIIPDFMGNFVAIFSTAKGPELNRIYTFFDQTLLGGAIDIVALSVFVILLLQKAPRLMRPFTFRQEHSNRVIILSALVGVVLHIVYDVYLYQ